MTSSASDGNGDQVVLCSALSAFSVSVSCSLCSLSLALSLCLSHSLSLVSSSSPSLLALSASLYLTSAQCPRAIGCPSCSVASFSGFSVTTTNMGVNLSITLT